MQQDEHLDCRHIRHALYKAVETHRLLGSRHQRGRAGRIPLGKPQTGKKQVARHEAIRGRELARQVGALLRMLVGGRKVVPLVKNAGQAKLGFARHRPRWIAGKLQHMAIGLGGRHQLVVQRLQRAQARGGHKVDDEMADGPADRNGFGVRAPGCGTVAPQMVSVSQSPRRRRAHRQVVGIEVLQRPA